LFDTKKGYSIQKIEITPQRLEIGIHNVNKSGLKIKFLVPEMVVALKKNEVFDFFCLSVLKNCIRRMKHKKCRK
jgi:hypothetical protein